MVGLHISKAAIPALCYSCVNTFTITSTLGAILLIYIINMYVSNIKSVADTRTVSVICMYRIMSCVEVMESVSHACSGAMGLAVTLPSHTSVCYAFSTVSE